MENDAIDNAFEKWIIDQITGGKQAFDTLRGPVLTITPSDLLDLEDAVRSAIKLGGTDVRETARV